MAGTSNERGWVAWLARRHAPPPGGLGIGDDAALLPLAPGLQLAATTDWFLEDLHFRRRERPEDCGYRLATRALSDLAAMGAEPLALLLSAAWPAGLAASWRRRLHAGLEAAARDSGAALAGGDLSRAARIAFDIVGLGRVRAGRALLRSGARPGDSLWVSGWLGYAAWGRRLGARAQPSDREQRRALARWRRPRARWELGRRLAQPGRASACMDVSDGLSLDLHRLCRASQVGAMVFAGRLPAPPPAGRSSRARSAAARRALDFALYGGEDYELLFTAPATARARLRRLASPTLPLTEIGVITRSRGLWLELDGGRERLPERGWDAFDAHGGNRRGGRATP